MTYSWRNDLANLRQYIDAHPGIEIDRGKAVIPREFKDGFYRCFDAARSTFVREHLAAEIQEGTELSQNYKALRGNILQESGLNAIEVPPETHWFLEDPPDALTRLLFNPLFGVLSRQSTPEQFEADARPMLSDAYSEFRHGGYRLWAALGLIFLLHPNRSFRFPAVDAITDCLMGEGHENPGQHVGDLPEVQESDRISFEQHPIISFIVPRAAVHSRRADLFVALHFDFREAEWSARKISPSMEWYRIADLKQKHNLSKLRPDILKKFWYEMTPILPDMGIYSAADISDLGLVADYKNMLRPDINVEVMDAGNWLANGKLDDVEKHHAAMRPRRGTFIVCRKLLEGSTRSELLEKLRRVPGDKKQPGITLIEAGYDISALEGIISAINKK
jgi:hypothetical protein